MGLTNYERETSIWYNKAEDNAICHSCDKSLMNQLDTYCTEYPEDFKFKRDIKSEGEVVGKEYIFDQKYITIRRPSNRKPMSEEQRKAASDRLKKARENSVKNDI